MDPVRACILIPTYDNPQTIRAVVEAAQAYLPTVIVVDDGSGPAARAICDELAAEGKAVLVRHPENRGKGAAVKTGFEKALGLGFTHAFQIDGDGQHDLSQIPAFMAAARAQPSSLILSYPVYDDTLHRGRYAARLVTRFWNFVEVLGPTIRDSMCGFRVYPIRAALDSATRGDRMSFDIEIPVRMVWNGVPIQNLPVGVRYLKASEGGVSHYRTLLDTTIISLTHARLVFEGLLRLLAYPFRRLGQRG